MEHYYQIKFGQGILDDTIIFINKIVEANDPHQVVDIVCGDWKWGYCIGPGMSSRLGRYTFSDRDGKWAQVQEVFPPECSGCEDVMFLKDEQWYCAYCDS